MPIFNHLYSSRTGKVLLSATLGATMLLGAGAAQAASLSASQISAITSLLQSFNVDVTTIGNVQTVLSGGSTASTTVAGSTGQINGSMIGFLHKGDHGQGVCYLHAILATDPSIATNITAGDTGSNCPFGALTENALKKFQSKHGIAALGFIGPATLKALEAELGNNPLAVENEDNNTASSTNTGDNQGHHFCAIIPPGHLIAPGWLRKNGNQMPVVPTCQTLPPGIEVQGDEHHGTTTPPVVDTTAPVISSVAAESIATTSATITWTTNEAATSKVYYSTASPIDFGSALSVTVAGLMTSHSVILTGLTASTTYNYAIVSADVSNNTATSSTTSLNTTP